MTTVFIIFYMQVNFGTRIFVLIIQLFLFKLIHINEYIIYIGTFGWLFVHGLKPVIYLSLNSTIRQEVAKMICGVKFHKFKIYIH
jgi:hypothetical protein